jgi:hypothetical protein
MLDGMRSWRMEIKRSTHRVEQPFISTDTPLMEHETHALAEMSIGGMRIVS